ncbi:SGNH/GDSL hydrolase family protein [Lacticaseibacillus paracasei]|nr:SGNH/GDSL hydrolase family protein [Lacticaseibacillus paracasei]MDM7472178.1 BppU family phage baseplate upper protein [Lacticaseibacillus paracasei]
MAIRTYKVTLDSKNVIAPEPVYLRQGDKTGAVVIDATLMDNGAPVSLNGLTPMFKANTADGQAVIADNNGFSITNPSGGELTYQVPNALAAVAGKITTAYFSFSDASGAESTFDVAFIVKKAVDITQEQASDYVAIIDGTMRTLQQKVDAMNNSIQTVVNAYNQGAFYNREQTDSKDAVTLSSANVYTDSSLKGISSVPETFANLAAIQIKYPNGANGVMVAADNGHKYIWANNVWTDAGVYQSVGIADNSIGIEKRTPQGTVAYVYSSPAVKANFDEGCFVFPSDDYGVYYDKHYGKDNLAVVDNKVPFEGHVGYIVFDVTTKRIRAINGPSPETNMAILGAYNTDTRTMSLNGPLVTRFNSRTPAGSNIIIFNTHPLNFNTTTRSLDNLDGSNFGMSIGQGHITYGDTKFDKLSFTAPLGYIYVNMDNHSIVEAPYGTNPAGVDMDSLVLIGAFNFNTNNFWLNCCPFTIDGLLPAEIKVAKNYYDKGEVDEIAKSQQQNVELYKTDFGDVSEWQNTAIGSKTQNGFEINGIGNMVLNHSFSIENRISVFKVHLESNSNIGFGYIANGGYAPGGTLFTIDVPNKMINLHDYWSDASTVPTVRKSASFNPNVSHDFVVTMIKNQRTNRIEVYDYVTGDVTSVDTTSTAVLNDVTNEFAGGRQNGCPSIVGIAGTCLIKSFRIVAPSVSNPVIIYGDSITEGDRVELGSRYADIIKQENSNVMVSGMSGTTIDSVIDRIRSENALKPKTIIVTIGTNGGNSPEKISALVKEVTDMNCQLILNHIPAKPDGSHVAVNNMIEQSWNGRSFRFDLATSKNNDPAQGQDTSLFADEFHPNAAGHENMAKRTYLD